MPKDFRGSNQDMLQSATGRPANPIAVGNAGRSQQRRLFMAVIVLLATILVVAFRDRAFWFSGDGESVAEDADESASTTAPSTAAAPATQASKKQQAARPTNAKVAAKAKGSELENASETERISMDQSARNLSINSPYPLLAGQMAIQGSVLLETLIGTDGVVEEMRVLSGPTILVSAAREAVRQWRFKPYLVNGQPVETQARVTVNFKIKVSDTVAANQVNSISSDGEL
jgi:TonB family protein